MIRIMSLPESPNSESGLKERWTHLGSVKVELMLPEEEEEGNLKRRKKGKTKINSKRWILLTDRQSPTRLNDRTDQINRNTDS